MRQFIKEYDSQLSPEECRMIIDFYNFSADKARDEYRNLFYLNLDPNKFEDHVGIDSLIFESISECVMQYYIDFKDVYHPNIKTQDSGYQIMMYEMDNSEYPFHSDAMLPNGVSERQLSVILYLNDLDEYGETWFKFQDHVVYPKAGTILIFPATPQFSYKETNHPEQDKYIVTTFVTAKYDQG